ncbi:hypothetical protein [Curtobacterium sp. SORGH_AS_0776]|uniref:hypothetical protein n=1 Tax=Curtobacterium sp. SORGH_AS_0776 TaxID=3041798 RepID=UPI002857187B|nr:hypothetical protein [Curtobacterium sp. SORGH_AS_0776]MDR6169771.1 hypothetical protein [Curtobacterium sp. SORGH_AS_0776]
MTDVLGLAAIVPASAGACCTVGAWRPGRAVDVVAAVVMVAAMLDGVVGPRVLPGVVWFVVLALLAVTVAAVHRFQSGRAGRDGSARAGRAGSAHGRYGRLHASLGLLAMGALGVGGMGDDVAHGVVAVGVHQHVGVVGATWHVVLVGLAVGHLVLTARMVRDGVRHRAPALGLVETLAMGIAVAVMAVAML